MKRKPFFASALKLLLVLCAILISIVTIVDYSRAAIVAPELEGASLVSDCQSSKPAVPVQATMSSRDQTSTKTVWGGLLAWLNQFFCGVPSARFSPVKTSGNESQPQVIPARQAEPSPKAAKPSKVERGNGSDSCLGEDEAWICKPPSSARPGGVPRWHAEIHRCAYAADCASATRLTRSCRNRLLSLGRCPA